MLGLVQVEDLLHELICGEGHGLGGHTADVVERKASVQSLLDAVLLIYVRQGLAQRPVSKNTDKDRTVLSSTCHCSVFIAELSSGVPASKFFQNKNPSLT